MLSTKSVAGASASLTLLVLGIAVFSFFSSPSEKSIIVLDDSIRINAGDTKTQTFTITAKFDYEVAIAVSNGTIRTCDPLNSTLYYAWKENDYSPSWYDASEREYVYARDLNYPRGLMVAYYPLYFLFHNQESYVKEVHVQVTVDESEQNTTNLQIASALTVSGAIVGLGVIATALRNKAKGRKNEERN